MLSGQPAGCWRYGLTDYGNGNRINRDVLERQGSGYVAHHGVDFLHAGDPWFRGMTVKYGPDGGVFVSDWTDTGECHNYEVVDRSNGRISRQASSSQGQLESFSRFAAAKLIPSVDSDAQCAQTLVSTSLPSGG